jgi:hypothetical protein
MGPPWRARESSWKLLSLATERSKNLTRYQNKIYAHGRSRENESDAREAEIRGEEAAEVDYEEFTVEYEGSRAVSAG